MFSPQITWSLDGADLPVTSAMSWNSFLSPDGDVITYVNISRAEVALGGNYTCWAKSGVGEDSHVSRVNVYGKFSSFSIITAYISVK